MKQWRFTYENEKPHGPSRIKSYDQDNNCIRVLHLCYWNVHGRPIWEIRHGNINNRVHGRKLYTTRLGWFNQYFFSKLIDKLK